MTLIATTHDMESIIREELDKAYVKKQVSIMNGWLIQEYGDEPGDQTEPIPLIDLVTLEETGNPHVIDLKKTWQVLVQYRDIALEESDFERSVLYSHVIEDFATMIQAAGGSLPDKLPRDI